MEIRKLGVTTMYMNEKMDAGDIILQKEVEIRDDETTGELWEKLAKMGASLLINTLEKIENNTAPRIKQGETYTLAPMLDKELAKIKWEEMKAYEIKNLVRGLNPIMGAYTYLNNKKFKFWKVQNISREEFFTIYDEFREYDYKFNSIEPGTVLYSSEKQGLFIKAKDEVISVLEIQGENSKKMNIQEFLRGNKIYAAEIFE